MDESSEYFDWLAQGGRIRVSARAIILNEMESSVLLERNMEIPNTFFNFVGGAIEIGETMEECIRRELSEETDARVSEVEYLFVAENFFPNDDGELRHSLEHYFDVRLDRDDVHSSNSVLVYEWTPIDQLGDMDARPIGVRDRIIDGSFRRISHLISRDAV